MSFNGQDDGGWGGDLHVLEPGGNVVVYGSGVSDHAQHQHGSIIVCCVQHRTVLKSTGWLCAAGSQTIGEGMTLSCIRWCFSICSIADVHDRNCIVKSRPAIGGTAVFCPKGSSL